MNRLVVLCVFSLCFLICQVEALTVLFYSAYGCSNSSLDLQWTFSYPSLQQPASTPVNTTCYNVSSLPINPYNNNTAAFSSLTYQCTPGGGLKVWTWKVPCNGKANPGGNSNTVYAESVGIDATPLSCSYPLITGGPPYVVNDVAVRVQCDNITLPTNTATPTYTDVHLHQASHAFILVAILLAVMIY